MSIRGLNIRYLSPRGDVKAVRNVSLDVHRGETLFLVGESGAGKSTLSLAILRLLPEKVGKITSGQLIYSSEEGDNLDITALRGRRLRRFRWKEASMVFQGAMNSLNPIMRIQGQLNDVVKAHRIRISKKKTREKMTSLLDIVKLDADRVLKSYSHQLSGGMRQRVMIAMSLLLDPKMVILDEPTTALDVLTQKNIMDVLKEISRRLSVTMIFITHDLSLAADLADRVAIMYAGTMVEIGDVEQIFYDPRHPYTFALLKSVPRLSSETGRIDSIPGSPPDMVNPPPGCGFHPRCMYRGERCDREEPFLEESEDNHFVACWRWREIFNGG